MQNLLKKFLRLIKRIKIRSRDARRRECIILLFARAGFSSMQNRDETRSRWSAKDEDRVSGQPEALAGHPRSPIFSWSLRFARLDRPRCRRRREISSRRSLSRVMRGLASANTPAYPVIYIHVRQRRETCTRQRESKKKKEKCTMQNIILIKIKKKKRDKPVVSRSPKKSTDGKRENIEEWSIIKFKRGRNVTYIHIL